MAELRISIPDCLEARLQAAMPEYLDRKGFVCLLLDQALTEGTNLPAYRVGAGTRQSEVTSGMQDLPTQQMQASALEAGQQAIAAPQGLGEGFEPKKTKTKNIGPKYVFSVPPDLEWCKAELLKYWKDYKTGKKTSAAGALLIKEIRRIAERYGQPVVMEQLDLACARNFESITLSNYERYGLPHRLGGAAPVEPRPEPKHPASRLFMNGRFVDEEPPATNPALQGLF